jgi:hypothetical protein
MADATIVISEVIYQRTARSLDVQDKAAIFANPRPNPLPTEDSPDLPLEWSTLL